jgi:DNA-binding transcriptional MerR regulator
VGEYLGDAARCEYLDGVKETWVNRLEETEVELTQVEERLEGVGQGEMNAAALRKAARETLREREQALERRRPELERQVVVAPEVGMDDRQGFG